MVSMSFFSVLVFTCTTVILLSGRVRSLEGETSQCEQGEYVPERYLLYNVNPGEGFNLRRDVYLRAANLVRSLNDKDPWVLVLPPWTGLYHWKSTPRERVFSWRDFFDMKSLNKWVPVIDLDEYIDKFGARVDSVYTLQNYAEGWDRDFEEKYDIRPCIQPRAVKTSEKGVEVYLGRNKLASAKFHCLSFQGRTGKIEAFLKEFEPYSRSVLFERFETALHDAFGEADYWSARRSMRFVPSLVEEARRFETMHLNVTPESNTVLPDDWRMFKPKSGQAVGGPYMSVHLRRKDFVRARPDEVPSIKYAAEQVARISRKLKFGAVFLSTDANAKEVEEFVKELNGTKVVVYNPDREFLEKFGDGGVAIVDQIIASHGKYFIGSHESTFSFRIQEEREILGFDRSTTFNRLCGSNEKCERPSKWEIVY